MCKQPAGKLQRTRAHAPSWLPKGAPGNSLHLQPPLLSSILPSFQVSPAWIAPQLITYRYFICLYDATAAGGTVSQRSGASLDVVSAGGEAYGGGKG